MSLCGGGHIEAETAIGSGLPSVLVHTGGCASCGGGSGLGVIGGSQLGQGHRSSSGATGTSTGENAGCGSGGILGCLVAVVVSQSGNSGLCSQDGVTDRAMCACGQAGGSTGCGNSGVSYGGVSLCGGGHIEAEATVGSGLPSVLVHTGGCASCGGGSGLGVIGGSQLGQSHRSSSGALGTSTRQGTRCRSRGILSSLVGIRVSGCGNGFCLSLSTIRASEGLNPCSGAGSSRGHCSGIPCMIYSIFVLTPIAVTGMLCRACRSVGKDMICLIYKAAFGTASGMLCGRQLAETIPVSLSLIGITADTISLMLVVISEGRVGELVCFRFAITTGTACSMICSVYLCIGISMSGCGISRGNGSIGCDIGQCLVPAFEGVVIGSIIRLGRGSTCVACRFSLVNKLSCKSITGSILKGNGVCRGGQFFVRSNKCIVVSDDGLGVRGRSEAGNMEDHTVDFLQCPYSVR